jgi:hypothetical protein
VKKWVFSDGTNTTTVTFNPGSMSSPYPSRNVTGFVTTNNTSLATEGATQLNDWTFSGTLRTKSEFEELEKWLSPFGSYAGGQIKITDHFGRDIMCIPKSFSVEPKRNMNHYWAHSWTAVVLVLSVGLATVGDNGQELED